MKEGKKNLSWVMWGSLAFSQVIVLFHRGSLAVIMDYLIVDFQIKDATLAGSLAGTYALVYMFMQIPSGLLADFWGPRKTVTLGMFINFSGSIIFALAPTLIFAFLGRAVIGLGVSVVFVSILKFQISWFPSTQFATIAGLTLFAGNFGWALATSPFALLVENLGWRYSFVIIGSASLLVAIITWLFVRDTPQDFYREKEPIISKSKIYIAKKKHIKDVCAALKIVVANPRTWILFVIAFGFIGTLLSFSGTWSLSYLMQVYGFDRSVSANYMLVLAFGKIIGFPVIGYISDKALKRKEPFLVFFAMYIIIWGLLLFWNGGKPPAIALYLIFFLMGFTTGAFIIIPALAKELNDPGYSGIAISVVNIGPFLGMAILPPLFGYILDKKWLGLVQNGVRFYPVEAYRLLFASCFVILLLCFALTFIIKETKCSNIYQNTDVHDN